jgi:hypothetical protein
MDRDFIKSYKEQRDRLRQRFEGEKTGEQTLFIDQTKLFKPLINTQKESADKIASSQDVLSNTLVPFTKELQKRNEQLETLQNLPYPVGIEDAPQSTPSSTPRKVIYVDLNGELLNQTHRENLQDLGLDLPSEVQAAGTYAEALNKAKTENKRIGQFLGINSKKDEKEKEVYKSQQLTLKIYKDKLKGLIEAEQFIQLKKTGATSAGVSGEGLHPKAPRALVKLKRGKGRPRKYPDTVYYSHPNELCVKLSENVAAKEAGNTGLDNIINSILDELLNIKFIDKDEYDNLFKKIFN